MNKSQNSMVLLYYWGVGVAERTLRKDNGTSWSTVGEIEDLRIVSQFWKNESDN